MCLPFCHNWEEVDRRKYRDLTFGYPGMIYYEVELKCTKCGDVKTKTLN